MFFGYTFIFAILICGAMLLFGEYALIYGVVLLIGAAFAGLYVSYCNTKERLERMEEKLDKLLSEREGPQSQTSSK